MAQFGWTEMVIVLVIVVLIFGVGKVADVGPAIGKAIRGFREAVREDEPPDKEEEGKEEEG
jgi:sec-independent protein translocase protein TatA